VPRSLNYGAAKTTAPPVAMTRCSRDRPEMAA
jgi:hypothetical protein